MWYLLTRLGGPPFRWVPVLKLRTIPPKRWGTRGSPEIVLEKINYCHNNPVKRGLAREPGDWRWSSYHWYIGKRDVPIEIDEFEGISRE